MRQPNYQTSVSGLTKEESELVDLLKAKGINVNSVFRRGLQAYERDLTGQENSVDKAAS